MGKGCWPKMLLGSCALPWQQLPEQSTQEKHFPGTAGPTCTGLSFNDTKHYYEWEMSCKCLVPCAHRHKMVSGWNCSTDKSLIGTVRNRGWVRMGSLVLQGRHYLGTLCLVGTWGNSVSRAVVALFLMSSCLGKHSSISGVKSCSESRANYQLVTAEDACSCSVA